jgi:hypothetical protein
MANLPIPRDGLTLPAAAYGIGDTELLVRKFGQAASHGAWAATWVYHQAYMPVGLWDEPSVIGFLKERITTGKRDLAGHPDAHAVLYGEAQQKGDGQYVPTGTTACYYMATNVAAPLSDAAMDDVGYHFRDALGLHIEQFGFATPQSMADASPGEVRRFAVDLLNSPSSYYFVAREGRVSVVPTTEHGMYATGVEGSAEFATTTSTLPGDVPGIADLQALVGSNATSEADLQAFLTERPHFLLGLDDAYCEIKPHVALSSPSNTKLIPDFMVRLDDPGRFALIELKKPNASLQSRSGQSGSVARSAAQAIKQLMEYADAVSTSSARSELRKSIGDVPFDPSLIVVIGRGSPDRRHVWRGLRAGLPNVHLVTYDYLLERARRSSSKNQRLLTEGGGPPLGGRSERPLPEMY